MKITLISLDNWGFNDFIAKAYRNNNHEVQHINFDSFQYKYPSVWYKIHNFFLKLLFRKNLKHSYYGQQIIKRLETFGQQDLVLTLKGDFIDRESIQNFKKYTKRSIAFFNDNVKRYPNIANVIPYFDEVFSFEKKDCEKYNLKFLTNFIYNEKESTKTQLEYDVFNISSKDKRTPQIIKIAENLKAQGIDYKIIILDKKNKIKNKNITTINQTISLAEVASFIDKATAVLDFHRSNQNGLSFRVFESLGLEKKLITTNQDIKNYDFYNPDNIFIIENENFEIPKNFFTQPYIPLQQELYDSYALNGWTKKLVG